MPRVPFQIDSIFAGQSETQHFSAKGQFNSSIGIDPDMPINDTDKRLSGYIRPTSMEKFTGTTLTSAPLWIVSNPKNATAYIYCADGTVYAVTDN